MSLAKSLKDIRHDLFYRLVSRRRVTEPLGDLAEGFAWYVNTAQLGPQSIVYSGGVGQNISFEQTVSKRFGCDVWLFDPSPTGAKTMSLPENQVDHFHFQPVGLAGGGGTLHISPPLHPEEGSWFAGEGDSSMAVPVESVVTFAQSRGHKCIDLLKLDIEGAEYEVIEDLIRHRFPVRQICVEFHHQMLPNIRRSQTIRAVMSLFRQGYRQIMKDGNNHTFLHTSCF